MFRMSLSAFTKDESFPFYIQYGVHEEPLYLHGHDNYFELVIVLSGTAVHIVDGERYSAKKGDVFVIGSDTEHGYDEPENFRICNIMFRKSVLDEVSEDLAGSVGFQALFVVEPNASMKKTFCSSLHLGSVEFSRISQLIHNMNCEYTSNLTGRIAMLKACFQTLVVTLSRLYDFEKISENKDMLKLAKVLAYIHTNYTSDVKVSKLAEIANYSQRQLIRLFHSTFDCVPSEYITQLRMQTARDMLIDGRMSVAEMAAQCGYTESNYFSRIFRKYNGLSPTEYREHFVKK